MTRIDLIAAEAEATVAKWGEAERAGAERAAASKTTSQLRYNHAQRTGAPAKEVYGRQAKHCNDHGIS